MQRRTCLAVPLAGLCRAQFGPPTGSKFAAIEKRRQEWVRTDSQWMRLETIGKSVEGRPLPQAWLTDPATPERGKERVLLTALHAGQEQSGSTGMKAISSRDGGMRSVLIEEKPSKRFATAARPPSAVMWSRMCFQLLHQ
jgi:Zinc carboxypeptidase